jgi:hypothetical protein
LPLAVAFAIAGLVSALPSAASGFAVDLSVSVSTTQAAAHPDATVTVTRTGTDDEDLRDMILTLPPGLIGNPEAVSAKCTQAQFSADACPAGSQVGTTTANATAVGLPLPAVTGSVYVLVPEPTDAGTLGIVLRPPLGVDKLFVVNHIQTQKLPSGDYALRNEVLGISRQVTLLGTPIDITLNSLQLVLNAHTTDGKAFLTNPTSCATAESSVEAISYLDQSATASDSFTPTGCDQVPFSPSLDFDMTNHAINAHTAPDVTVNVPGNEEPLRQSHVKDVHIRFPPGVTLDILAAFGVPQCPIDQLEADACPPASDIGDIGVAVPVLPPDFTGDVYRVPPGPTDVYAFGAVLRGPRGVTATARGGSFIDTTTTEDGIVVRLNSDFLNLPQIPFTRFELKLTNPFFINPPTCGTRNAEAQLVGHSGAVANITAPYNVNGCLPRPRGATPFRASLVPAYKPCTAPNSTHGAPLASPSCTPPTPESGSLTVGTPDANGAQANSVGSLLMQVHPGDTETPGDQADVALTFGLSDVRNKADLSDYTGSLLARTTLRVSDQANGASGDQPGTIQDVPFEFPVPCTPTVGTSGSDCSAATTADAVVPGIVVEGTRAIWELSQWQVDDGGPDGNVTTADNTVFARQGVFVP